MKLHRVSQRKPKFRLKTEVTNFMSSFSKKSSSLSPSDDPLTSFQPMVPLVSEETVNFIKAKEDFKNSMNFNGTLYRF